MRRLSLNARLMQEVNTTDQVYVVLLEIVHPALVEPIRLSTDNADRISSSPLIYGTRSTWRGADPISSPYFWVIASAIVPSDQDDAPANGNIVLDNLDQGAAELLLSFTDLATLNLAVVLASSPDLVEAEWLGMHITTASIDTGEINIQFSREEIELENFPVGRLTRNNFPGLHL